MEVSPPVPPNPGARVTWWKLGQRGKGENTLASLLPPSSLMPAPPIGWTPREASRKGSLGNAAPRTRTVNKWLRQDLNPGLVQPNKSQLLSWKTQQPTLNFFRVAPAVPRGNERLR